MAIDRRLGPVRRLAVLRALSLGDLLCATPALRALRARFPRAHLTLVGQPWMSEWAKRMPFVDDCVAMPAHPLTSEQMSVADPASWDSFVHTMQQRQLDLAVQLHGSGRLSNGVVAQWGARQVLAFHEPGQPVPPNVIGQTWPKRGTEVGRLLQLVRALGLPAHAVPHVRLFHPVEDADRRAALALLQAHGLRPGHTTGWICVHPGAKWPSRRWPVQAFAEVARELAQRGHQIVITGTEGEHDLAAAVQAQVPQAINLAGCTNLWTLGALIDGARLLVCNDTGVSHVAAARQTPSVVISSGSDVARWAPADPVRHRVLWSHRPCRPCEHPICPYEHGCAYDIAPEKVLHEALQQLGDAQACSRWRLS
ncbi:LPS biosynthesis glycosyltransferase [Aquabacterium fontiphilum]|jgi:ADP-heptose:LPS heptosyltransferase|uniref:glycosyltransferase family 9 protein n=1 Tax=Aquabacterium fontiphilum TaxID=450365 RepID=UPI001377CC07|nr:glycosyltransferase family 9 protein [Aquabacterium fontiphilum]NBD22090.1 LPS biosynthesis glycosyltransferase [Aquabacterium fontiphilum]